MKGDFTRRTFKPLKHYSSVQMQQGRVQLDSDWNEEVDIIDRRWRATLEDTVGRNGVPKVDGGFGITAVSGPNGEDLFLSAGRLYVDGILCEVDAPYLAGSVGNAGTLSVNGVMAGETTLAKDLWIEVSTATGTPIAQGMIDSVTAPAAGSATSTLSLKALSASLPATGTAVRVSPMVSYLTQPDLKSPPAIDTSVPSGQYFGNTYMAYLDVFQRHLTALDDPSIREVALNGPDTGTRTRTTWQVRLVEVDSTAKCDDVILPADPPPAAGPFAAPVAGTGRMRARAVPTSDPTQDCLLPAEAGYRRLENQLYRVEVHRPGGYSTATFKWSRDNGSVAVSWTGSPKPTEITIDGTPQDTAQGFSSGQWVELIDDVRDVSPDASVLGTFVQLGIPSGDTLTIDPTTATGSVTFTDFRGHPKVRRWEAAPTQVNLVGADGWIGLEDGVEVQFDSSDPNAWFNKGDYWLIPARTATTDVEWPNDPPGMPVALGAHGVEHRYCALALIQVHSGGQLTVLDCRPQFPALTAIAAADVSYDNTNCQLINATNVQQALDALCKARDLAHHNKLIHGYGIVCGLQVQCSSNPGMWVTVKSGYAIDCNGSDLEIGDTPVDVGQLVGSIQPSPLTNGNGELALMIGLDQNAQVKVTAEAYKPQQTTEVEEIFGGTLLLDFFDDCIKPIQQFMQAEVANLPGDPPVTGGQELASALVNLVAQGPNPQAGQNVYISAKDHQLLSSFYADLRPRLTSDTFCALFENARPYPTAAADGQLPHIFGTGQQTRLKWRPGTIAANTREIFTISNGSDPTRIEPRLNRYNADTRTLIAQLDPTGGVNTGPIVDFTFSADGNTVYLILDSAASPTDTLYRAGTLTATGVTWSTPLITLTGSRLSAIEGYFVGVPRLIGVAAGRGVYVVDPTTITSPSTQLQLTYPLNAFGQVALMTRYEPYAVLAAVPFNSNVSAAPSVYNGIWTLLSWGGGGFPISGPIAGSGSDGIVWGGVGGRELFVVLDGSPKVVTGYEYNFGAGLVRINDASGNPMSVPVDNCPIRMATIPDTIPAPMGNLLCWASQDFYALNLVSLATHQPVSGWGLPTQVGPIGLDYSWARNELAVLNRPADTILRVPGSLLGTAPNVVTLTQTIFNNAVVYHAAAVEAYVDLLAGFLQYLKDCFFDHVAVKCAQCNPRNQKLYLGVVSIRGGKVHNVCNFSGRHYLKTFPTIGYWLSLMPIIPLLSEVIESLACFVIPDAAAGYSVPAYSKQLAGSTPAWSLRSLFNTWQDVQKLDLRAQLNQLLQRIGLSTHLAGVAAGFSTAAPPAPGRTGFVAGMSTASAVGALAQLGMTTQTQTFRPSLGPQLVNNLVDVFRPPIDPSGPVTLHEVGGQVLFASSAPPAQPSVTSLQQQLQAKEQQLAQVQTQLATVNTQLADLHTFRQQVTQQLATMSSGQAPTRTTRPKR